MKKFILPILIAVLWIFYRTNQYFEDKINQNPQVKSLEIQKRFFLPFPKNYELISEYEENGEDIKIVNTKEDINYLNSFYQEILRSKNYQKDYEYENENNYNQEFKYSKDKQEIIIILNQQENSTSIIFKNIE